MLCSKVFLICATVFLAVESQNYEFTPKEDDLEFYDKENSQKFAPVRLTMNKSGKIQAFGSSLTVNRCNCGVLECKCCITVAVRRLRLESEFCAYIFYNSNNRAVQMQLLVNSLALADLEVSLDRPKSICLPILIPIPIFACLKIYNVSIVDNDIELCVALLLSFVRTEVFQIKLGCLKIGPQGIKVTRKLNSKESLDYNNINTSNYTENASVSETANDYLAADVDAIQ